MYPEKYFLISDYQSMELLGVNGLFTNLRVERESLPEGFYKYSIREGDVDPFTSVKDDVFVNHMGDFICKEELDMNGQEELDLFGDYSFTDDEVNLNEFFGVDIKDKIAQELDEFYYEFDTYDYNDKLPTDGSRENVVEDLRRDLSDKSRVEGIIRFFQGLLKENENENFLSSESEQKVRSFVYVLTEVNKNNHDKLDVVIEKANNIKDKAHQNELNKQPEIQQ